MFYCMLHCQAPLDSTVEPSYTNSYCNCPIDQKLTSNRFSMVGLYLEAFFDVEGGVRQTSWTVKRVSCLAPHA